MQRSSRTTITFTIFASLVLALLLRPEPVVAQPEAEPDSLRLGEALQSHQYPIHLNDGMLRGEGGQMLRARAAEATVTVLGESHGTKDIPALMSALLTDLQAQDEVDYLALETSPWTTTQMTDSLQKGQAAYTQLVAAHPEALPFYNLQSERALIAEFVSQS
jgi:hypothetical protein